MDAFNIDTFRHAAPYIYAHQGHVFVVSISSELVGGEKLSGFIQDLALIQTLGIKLVLVHGSNLIASGKSTPINQKKLARIQQTVGEQRVRIESLFSTGLINTPMAGMKLTTVSGNFVHAKPVGVINGVDQQFLGDVRRVDVHAIQHQLTHGNIVLLPPLGYSPSGECFYVDAYNVASTVAASLPSEKLIFLMNEKTLQDSRKQRIKFLTLENAQRLLNRRKSLNAQVRQYIELAINACLNRVQRVHLLSTEIEGVLLHELFSHEGAGTLITAEHYDDIRPATIEDVGGIVSLIKPLEQQKILVPRSREQIELEIGNYDIIERDGFIVACGALHPFIKQAVGEIACLAVHPDFQKEGHGARLLKHLEQKAWSQQLDKLFVLTTGALHWFREQGYCKSDVQDLPVAKQKTYNYQRNSRVFLKSPR